MANDVQELILGCIISDWMGPIICYDIIRQCSPNKCIYCSTHCLRIPHPYDRGACITAKLLTY